MHRVVRGTGFKTRSKGLEAFILVGSVSLSQPAAFMPIEAIFGIVYGFIIPLLRQSKLWIAKKQKSALRIPQVLIMRRRLRRASYSYSVQRSKLVGGKIIFVSIINYK